MLSALVNLLVMAVDLAVLLIAIRWLCLHRYYRWASAIDAAMAPAVDALLFKVQRSWAKLRSSRKLSTRGQLILAAAMLIVMRLLFVTVWMAMR